MIRFCGGIVLRGGLSTAGIVGHPGALNLFTTLLPWSLPDRVTHGGSLSSVEKINHSPPVGVTVLLEPEDPVTQTPLTPSLLYFYSHARHPLVREKAVDNTASRLPRRRRQLSPPADSLARVLTDSPSQRPTLRVGLEGTLHPRGAPHGGCEPPSDC